jgi:hypothetical protein
VPMPEGSSSDMPSSPEEPTLSGELSLLPSVRSDGPSILMADLVALIHHEVESTLGGREEEAPPNGMNSYDLMGYAIGSERRTKRLQRLLWTVTVMLVLVVGFVSAVVILASTDHHGIGRVGLAAAGIAGIGASAAKVWHSFNRARRNRRAASGTHDLLSHTQADDRRGTD